MIVGDCDGVWADGESHCPACCLTFGSLEDFDAHRTGLMSTRRCMDPKISGLWPEVTGHGVVWTSQHPDGSL